MFFLLSQYLHRGTSLQCVQSLFVIIILIYLFFVIIDQYVCVCDDTCVLCK